MLILLVDCLSDRYSYKLHLMLQVVPNRSPCDPVEGRKKYFTILEKSPNYEQIFVYQNFCPDPVTSLGPPAVSCDPSEES